MAAAPSKPPISVVRLTGMLLEGPAWLIRHLARFLPEGIKKRIAKNAMRAAATHPGAGLLYYYIRGDFDREVAGVIEGRLLAEAKHLPENENARRFALRRATHRLEKGLIMKERRPVFATDYIGDAVDNYVGLFENAACLEDPLFQWSHDVLDEYFSLVQKEGVIASAHEKYLRVAAKPSCTMTRAVPFVRDPKGNGMQIEDLEKLALYRRSCRWYKQEKVPRDLVDRAVAVAGFSPSACNRQPFEFRIFDDPVLIQKIGSLAGGARNFVQNFPGFIVIVGNLEAYPHEYDRHVIYIDGSLAAMSLIYALEVQGIGSCCINWGDRRGPDEKMAAYLGLSRRQRPVMCMSYGFPDTEGKVPFSQKKTLDELRSYNEAKP